MIKKREEIKLIADSEEELAAGIADHMREGKYTCIAQGRRNDGMWQATLVTVKRR